MASLTRSFVRQEFERLYALESRRVLATLIRLLGEFDLAEEALHEAFVAAMVQWPTQGMPANPRAWLISTGRFKAIDQLRRRARLDASELAIAESLYAGCAEALSGDEGHLEDDRLRLMFTCCHPSLSSEAQIALTLREVCGLTTEEIAAAFLTPTPTIAQRIVRAKRKIQAARIPYEVPSASELPERLDSVLHAIYLVFNEGYSASSGDALTRAGLSAEAIRLGRLLVELLPEAECLGLLALMLLHESRRAARSSAEGELILLDQQDRNLWNRDMIAEGCALTRRALSSRRVGAYSLQAAIAAVHAEAKTPEATDWREIVGLYDLLLQANPNPVVALNRAVAVAMSDGAAAGVTLLEDLLARGQLHNYHLAHSACAELYRRLGRTDEARAAYGRALALVRQGPERRFLEQQISKLS